MNSNVLIIVIDSLRSDKIFGNYKTAKTPILDNLIKNGIFFPNNISSADGTVLSWASMLTALEPFKTANQSNRYHEIDFNITNYFTLIKKAGYNIFGCVPTLGKSFRMMSEFENTDKIYDNFMGISDGLGEKILEQLKSLSRKEPWLYFVHLNDIHFPVIPPKPFDHQEFGECKYDRAISSIDSWLGKILKNIDLKKTLVIITADHGANIPCIKIDNRWLSFETDGSRQKFATKVGNKVPSFLEPIKSKFFFQIENFRKKNKEYKFKDFSLTPFQERSIFSQRGDIDHTLFDERIKVPLLFFGNGIKSKKIILTQVRTIDIFPTIFDILNLQSFEKNIDGMSLVPIMNDLIHTELPALIVSSPLIEKKSNDVIGLRTSQYKYFRDKDNEKRRVFLFDLQSDPLEEKNIAELKPEIVEKMEKILNEKQIDSKSINSEYSEDELKNIEKELKKLGYT